MAQLRPAPEIETPGFLIFRLLYGSWAHGTNNASSDEDWRGVYQIPNDDFLGLTTPKTTFEDRSHDQVYWELGHFCRLLLKGNPNIVGMLYAPDDVLEVVHMAFLPLIDYRRLFIHKATISAYMGWVKRELRDLSDLKRAPAKRLSHLPRLMWEIEGALKTGDINVRPDGAQHDTIMAIKNGTMPYDDGIALCGSMLIDLEDLVEQLEPTVPHPPIDWTRDYLLDTRRAYG